MFKQYRKNPIGWCFYRVENLKLSKGSLKYKIIQCIHYVSSSILSKNKRFLLESPNKVLTILSIPLGLVLYFYILYKTRNLKLS